MIKGEAIVCRYCNRTLLRLHSLVPHAREMIDNGKTPRGNDMFMVMAKRSIAMCEDLERVSLLAGG